MKNKEYNYGDPIPEKYRNRLYEWEGGGYSGCIYEMNQGLVDAEGHWHPIYSTGHDGIDQDEWFERKINALKDELGYACTSVDVQHQEAKHRAVEEVFHKKWFEVSSDPDDYPEVKKLLEKEEHRYAAWISGRDSYRLEKTHRLDAMFMQALERECERDRPSEIGMIDDKHIKETCRIFCESYKGNVGMMTHCLDKMEKMGYDVWCTCSDCGEQFQRGDYETFGCSVDNDAYTGDGGIGVIMKRVVCDECRAECQCPECWNLTRPNPRSKRRDDWQDYNLLSCVMVEWLDVCNACTDGFENEHLLRWDQVLNERVRTPLGDEYYTLCEKLENQYGCKDHELYLRLNETRAGKEMVNKIRDLVCEAAREYFGNGIDEDWFGYRLDTEDPRQMKMEFGNPENKTKENGDED